MMITVKEAVIVSIIVESVLYGVLTFLFGVAVWALTYQRTSAEIVRLVLGAAFLLFVLGTMHIVVDANHFWQGFITSGDPSAFFQDAPKNTFKNILYLIETLVGDGVIIYRAYVVWQRVEFVIIPIIGWVATVVTGTYTIWAISQLSATNPNIIFLRQTGQWIISFYSTALATNLVATGLLIVKLWVADRSDVGLRFTSTSRSVVRPILVIIIECGAVYSLSMITMLAVYLSASNISYIMIDMIGQIIPITFCAIIVRGAMLRFENDRGLGFSLNTLTSPRSHEISTPRSTRVHVRHVTIVDSDDPPELSRQGDLWGDSVTDKKREERIASIEGAV
ncbi:hypothetical protein PAXINDRAFT_17343 [Paxillus involutus ATCC 200175]|uniref:Unplaced genomic scaffold PAXINscaffold_129, whole genome shotgun sequence n=1 Tax=Paxillus involutus ATCC 200175 TaxID=664439 RepID=A0A0C9TQW3_PAXIN|nr:hypothetical protein PAXINDRAFT_17343 [Paxillus involutus ATCC 200175]